MLILSRKRNEAIVIGDTGEITVKVLSIRGSVVKLGLEAPKEVPIRRERVEDVDDE